ncbi:MAG: prepilin-type N-terminal cleavage/methylation domain-containing protein, partial [Raoultibacter sp.]
MNEMIKKVRGDKKGFTLAELLIVVAIILVLVAIAIPVFTGAMDSANK